MQSSAQSQIPEKRAAAIAKQAVIDREKWARKGWPIEANIIAIDHPNGWMISVFPPIDLDYKANHLQIEISNQTGIVKF